MYKHILVAHDGSETSAHAFDAALQMARESGAELQPLFVVDVPIMNYDVPGYDPTYLRDALFEEGTHVVGDALQRMKRDGIAGGTRIIEVDPVGDDIAHGILRAATELKADLVVMGTHGRRGFRRLVLGSVAEGFLRLAQCPVLLIPAQHAAEGAARVQAEGEPLREPS